MENKFNPEKIKLIIGLGNAGSIYQNTYHNVGILAVDYLGRALNQKFRSATNKKFSYTKNGDLIFAKPNNFMNKNGESTKAALRSFRLKPNALLVIHDDSDVLIGKYKITFGRGSAGHKGVQSLFNNLNTQNFWRFRIGIRKNEKTREKAENFVLRKISSADQRILNDTFGVIQRHFA